MALVVCDARQCVPAGCDARQCVIEELLYRCVMHASVSLRDVMVCDARQCVPAG